MLEMGWRVSIVANGKEIKIVDGGVPKVQWKVGVKIDEKVQTPRIEGKGKRISYF